MSGILTNNSPVAGSISWREFTLTIEGVAYTFPAGSTTKKVVWWIAGATSLSVGDEVPADLTSEDCLLFANRNGVAINATTATALNGDLIVPGTVVAEHIAADSIKAGHLATDSVTAKALVSDLILAEHISAGAVTAESLSVGSVGDNLITNGSFEDISDGSPEGWVATTMTGGTILPVSGVSSSGAVSVEFNATTTTANLRLAQSVSKAIPVSNVQGRRWHVSVRVGASIATTRGLYLRATWLDASRAILAIQPTDIASNIAISTTFDVIEGQVTPPSTARYMRVEVFLLSPNVLTKMYVDEVAAREVIMSAVIGEGQVTATHMKTGTITADSGVISSLSGGVIQAGTIAADRLLVSDFTNLVDDPELLRKPGVWSVALGVLGDSSTGNTFEGRESAKFSGNSSLVQGRAISVQPEDRLRITLWYKTSADYAGAGGIRIQDVATGGEAITWVSGSGGELSAIKNTAWTPVTSVVSIKAGVYSIRPRLAFALSAGSAWIGRYEVRRMNGGELLVDGTIKANSAIIDNLAIADAKISNLNGGKIVADTITGTQIKSKSISVDHLLVGSTDNVIPDPQFTNNDLDWGVVAAPYSITTTEGRDGGNALKIAMSAAQQGRYSKAIRVEGGESFRVSVWVKSSVAAPANSFGLYFNGTTRITGAAIGGVQFLKKADGISAGSDAIAANVWTLLSGVATIPATAATISLGFYTEPILSTGNVWFSEASAFRMGDGNLIVDGSITAKSMKANTITVQSGIIAELDATKITYGELDGKIIKSGTVLAKTLAVGDFNNLIPNNTLKIPTGESLPTSWTRSGTSTATSIADTTGLPGPSFKLDGIGSQVYVWTDLFDVTPTDSLKLSYRSQNQLTGTGSTAQIRFYWYSKTGAPSATASSSYTVPAGSWSSQTIPTPTEVPADAYQCRVMILVSGSTSTGGSWWIGDLAVRRMFGGSLIVDGAIKAGSAIIEDSAITSAKIISLDGGKITANTITGTQIKSKSISVDHLLVGSTDNVIPDAQFTNKNSEWTVGTSTLYSYPTTEGMDGQSAFKIATTTATQAGQYSADILVNEGETFRFSVWVKSTVAIPESTSASDTWVGLYVNRAPLGSTTFGSAVEITRYNKVVAGVSTETVGHPAIAANAWGLISGTFTVPVGTGKIRVGMFQQSRMTASAIVRFSDASGYRMGDGNLIVDGAITAKKIGVGELDATKGVIGQLDASKITYKEMNGKYIEANTIAANKLLVSGANLLPDPNFISVASLDAIRLSSPNLTITTNSSENLVVRPASTARLYLRPYGVEQVVGTFKEWIPVVPGEEYLFTAKVTYAGTGDARLTFRSADGLTLINPVKPAVWTAFTSGVPHAESITIPVGAYWALPEIRLEGSATDAIIEKGSLSLRKKADGELIVDGAIKAGSAIIDNLAITDAKIGSLNGAKIVAGSITGKEIEAKSIFVDNLLIGSTDNVIPDPEFTNKDLGWRPYTDSFFSFPTTEGVDGNSCLKITSSTAGQRGVYSKPIPVTASKADALESFRVSLWVKSSVAVSAGNSINLYARDYALGASSPGTKVINFWTTENASTGLKTRTAGNPALVANQWTLLIGEFTVPVGTGRTAFGAYVQTAYGTGTVWFSNFAAYRMGDGNMVLDGSLTGDHIHANTIDAVHLKANSIEADKIKAGVIDVSKLMIGSSDNLVADPQFKDSALTTWRNLTSNATVDAGWYPASTYIRSRAGLAAGSYTFRMRNSVTGDLYEDMAVVPGRTYRIRYEFFRSSAATGTTRAAVYTKTTSGTTAFLGDGTSSETLVSGWKYYEREYTVPADVYSMSLAVQLLSYTGGATDYVAFRNVAMTVMAGGELIVNGAINGHTITGAIIKTKDDLTTGTTPKRGIEINGKDTNNYLRAYTATGATSFDLDGNTGDALITGVFQTALSGRRAKISDRNTEAALDLWSDTTGAHASMFAYKGETYNTSLRHYTDASNWSFEYAITNNGFYIQDGGSAPHLRGLPGLLYSQIVYNREYTGTSGNVVITSAGILGRGTSKRANKLAIEPLPETYDDKILSLQAHTWYDRQESEDVAELYHLEYQGEPTRDSEGNDIVPTPDQLRRVPGMIAEEVAEAGLPEFIQYGAEGQVEGLMYERLGVALIPVVARLRDRIDAQDVKIAQQDTEIAELKDSLALLMDRVSALESPGGSAA